MLLPHFDVLCDLLLNRRTATWNLFVLYNKELKKVLMMTSSMHLSSNRSSVRTNQNVCITEQSLLYKQQQLTNTKEFEFL